MIKFAIALLAVVGSAFVLNTYFPSVMTAVAFHVGGVGVAWAFPILGTVFFLAIRRKGK